VATEALREQTERAAAVATALSELEVELTDGRRAAVQQADAMSELAGVRTELEDGPDRARGASRASTVRRGPDPRAAGSTEAGQDSAQRATELGTASMPEAEDLSLMLHAAERGVTGIIGRFGDWQENVEPLIRSVQQGIETARGRIVRIPDQIREAVDSMTEAMMAVSDSLDRLAALPGPLSGDASPETPETSLDSPAETVIRLKNDDPGSRRTLVLPSDAWTDEHAEADEASSASGWADPDAPAEARDEENERPHGDHVEHAQLSEPDVDRMYRASIRPSEERGR